MFSFQIKHSEGDKNLKIDFDKIRKDDKKEREKLLRKYLPLIKEKAKINGMIDEDLMQNMILAIYDNFLYNYNPKRGSFITYLYYKLESCKQDYFRKEGENPCRSINEVMSEGVPLDQCLESDVDIEEEVLNLLLIKDVLGDFSNKIQYIIKEYYIKEKTLKEIGEKLGFSYEAIRLCLLRAKDEVKEKDMADIKIN